MADLSRRGLLAALFASAAVSPLTGGTPAPVAFTLEGSNDGRRWKDLSEGDHPARYWRISLPEPPTRSVNIEYLFRPGQPPTQVSVRY